MCTKFVWNYRFFVCVNLIDPHNHRHHTLNSKNSKDCKRRKRKSRSFSSMSVAHSESDSRHSELKDSYTVQTLLKRFTTDSDTLDRDLHFEFLEIRSYPANKSFKGIYFFEILNITFYNTFYRRRKIFLSTHYFSKRTILFLALITYY